VFTVGHGARSIGEFLATLTEVSVGVLVDIRRFPGSRRHPQFGRDALAASLREDGIRYEWEGETLGGRRSASGATRHAALQNAVFAAYADHKDTPGFRSAVEALVARRDTLAVMCAETLWWHCHRMLVADALTMRGADVVHLLGPGKRQPHRLHATVRRGEDGWPIYDVADTIPGL
jgi:uncharacterized protein (DUF488 family)